MFEIVDILMVEHSLIRQISGWIRTDDSPQFGEFRSYVKDCHIEIEEKLVFPVILESIPDQMANESTRVKQIQADHKLLLKLSENLDRWIEKGDQSLIRERAPLYIRLLKDHNANEDKFVFRWWNPSDHSHENDVIREASSVIENFGVDRYLAITGASKELFEKMFKK